MSRIIPFHGDDLDKHENDLRFYRGALRKEERRRSDPSLGRSQRYQQITTEFVGLAKGVMLDGVLNEDELNGIVSWLGRHQEFINYYPFYLVMERLQAAQEDGYVDDDERRELGELLHEIASGIVPRDALAAPSIADREEELEDDAGTELTYEVAGTSFLDDPEPAVLFSERVFVFTGCCASATRLLCEEAVRQAGGSTGSAVTKKTDYLVIGVIGSDAWAYTSHGTKIEKALDYKQRFGKPYIISEPHWLEQLERWAPGALPHH